MDFSQIINNLSAIDIKQLLLIVKAIFLLLTLYFIGVIIFVLAKTKWLKYLILWDLSEFMTFKHFALSGVSKKWSKIKEKIEAGTSAEAKLAIIEADDLLNDVLLKMEYKGKTLGEKLDLLNIEIMPNLEQLKQAHRVRSNIIHDPSYHLDAQASQRIIAVYEKALENLQTL
jgi:hypothetical protein